MHDIDDLIADHDEESLRSEPPKQETDESLYSVRQRSEVGVVERFFDRIGVAAIHLSGGLKVGDTIEIEGDPEPIRVAVSGMQIDRKDVESASPGDSIGVRVGSIVKKGSRVYIV
jgi:translation elongation factor EF-Tu-like GTPase